MRILIVDDDDSRLILKYWLTSQGYVVEEARDGAQALEKARGQPPDLVISDILMPFMDGFMLCSEVRSDPNLKDLPFVFYTATYTDAEDEQLGLSLGANAFIRKPISEDAFIEEIKQILHKGENGSLMKGLPELTLDDAFIETHRRRLLYKIDKKILELKEETLARKESEALLKATLDAIPDLILRLDTTGHILHIKPDRNGIFSLPPDQVVGKTVEAVFPREMAEKLMEGIGQCRQDETVESGCTISREGDLLYLVLRFSCTDQGHFVVVAQDVTAQKVSENMLRSSEKKYRDLFKNSLDAIAVIHADDRILDANAAFMDLFGYPSDQMHRLHFSHLFAHEPDYHAYHIALKSQGFLRDEEMVFVRRNNHRILCQFTAVAQKDDSGNLTTIQILLRDITHIRKMEMEYQQRRKMEALGRLVAGIAHEFNNMLNIILGYAEIILESLSPHSSLYKDVTEIENAAKRLAEIVGRLMVFSRKYPMKTKSVEIHPLIQDYCRMLERILGEEIKLTFTPGPDLWKVSINPAELDQILTNLAINSRDAIDDVGSIHIATSNVTLYDNDCRFHLDLVPGDYVRIIFSDTGRGMDTGTLEKIYDPFFSSKELADGTGLGLSVVYGIVKKYQGAIFAYSEPGQGTEFKIYFPRSDKGEPLERPTIESDKMIGRTGTILVVEDEPQILKLCRRLLEDQGYTVLIARSPEEALQLFEIHHEVVSLLISDVVMPGMRGSQLAELIHGKNPHLPVLFMSGYSDLISAKRRIAHHRVQFLHKPFTQLDLLRKVRLLLDAKPEG